MLTEGLMFDAGGVELRELAARRFKRPQSRFLLAAVASVGAHAILLTFLGIWFRFAKPVPRHDDDIPVTIIELHATGLAGGGGGSAGIKHLTQHLHRVAPARSTVVAMPKAKLHHQIVAKTAAQQIVNSDLQVTKPLDTEQRKLDIAPKAVPVPGSPIASGSAQNTAGGTGTGVGGGNGSGNGVGSGSGSGGGYGTGGDGPEAVYAPAPAIPDDMRDQVMKVIAVARFEVSRDGTAKVTLLNATDYSELNDIILDTLKQWRFKPAMNDGVAIDSVADVRLVITVK